MGWNRLIGVRMFLAEGNERLACWHDNFHTSAKLCWVSRKPLSFFSLSVSELDSCKPSRTSFEDKTTFLQPR